MRPSLIPNITPHGLPTFPDLSIKPQSSNRHDPDHFSLHQYSRAPLVLAINLVKSQKISVGGFPSPSPRKLPQPKFVTYSYHKCLKLGLGWGTSIGVQGLVYYWFYAQGALLDRLMVYTGDGSKFGHMQGK